MMRDVPFGVLNLLKLTSIEPGLPPFAAGVTESTRPVKVLPSGTNRAPVDE
jgi:hypothetical protein